MIHNFRVKAQCSPTTTFLIEFKPFPGANELAYLAQRMIRRNPLLRPDVREKAALILEPSAHLTLPQNHCGKSESPPLRSGELFQQTARGVLSFRSEAR